MAACSLTLQSGDLRQRVYLPRVEAVHQRGFLRRQLKLVHVVGVVDQGIVDQGTSAELSYAYGASLSSISSSISLSAHCLQLLPRPGCEQLGLCRFVFRPSYFFLTTLTRTLSGHYTALSLSLHRPRLLVQCCLAFVFSQRELFLSLTTLRAWPLRAPSPAAFPSPTQLAASLLSARSSSASR